MKGFPIGSAPLTSQLVPPQGLDSLIQYGAVIRLADHYSSWHGGTFKGAIVLIGTTFSDLNVAPLPNFLKLRWCQPATGKYSDELGPS